MESDSRAGAVGVPEPEEGPRSPPDDAPRSDPGHVAFMPDAGRYSVQDAPGTVAV